MTLKTNKRIVWLGIAWFLVSIVLGIGAGKLTKDLGYQALHAEVSDRLLASIHRVRGALNSYHYLPFLLTQNEDVVELLQNSALSNNAAQATKVSRYLEQTSLVAGASGLFIVDKNGHTVAYSNWRDQQALRPDEFAQLPVFQFAAKGEEGRFYEHQSQQQAFYYLSAPIYDRSDFIGAAIVRIDLENLILDTPVEELYAISDDQGRIFIASPQDWLKYSLSDLADIRSITLGNGTHAELWTFNQQHYMSHQVRLDDLGWTFTSLVSARLDERYADLVAAITMAGLWILGVLLLFLRERHLKHLSQQETRLALLQANESLEQKVEERTQALRNAQQELVQTSKMAALGRMSTAIAHELNQPLTAMRTYIAISKQLLSDPAMVKENLATLDDLTERMAIITSQLKTFAYKKPENVQPVPLVTAINQSFTLLRTRLTEEKVTLECDKVSDSHYVLGDNVRLEQVLVNLINNACDALHQQTDKHILIQSECVSDDKIQLSVEDNGPGFNDEQLEHLFEPFYTTKSMGNGLGLGLAIVAAIIRDLNGSIQAQRNVHGGATFLILLPSAQQRQ